MSYASPMSYGATQGPYSTMDYYGGQAYYANQNPNYYNPYDVAAADQAAGQIAAAQAAAQPGIMSAQNQMAIFNQVFPFVESAYGSFGTTGQPGSSNYGINTAPIYSPAMIQQQVNNQQAFNDATTQSQINQSQQQLGAQGFSGNSPLLAALTQQYLGQNNAANSQAAYGIQQQAAQQNAAYQQAGQIAAAQVGLGEQQNLTSLLASLMGMV